jgi:ribose 5-phosphate isomerase B
MIAAPMRKEIVTAEDVWAAPAGGEIRASVGAVVTPWAQEVATSRGIRIVQAPKGEPSRVIALGADHGGFALKEAIKKALERQGVPCRDFGTFSTEPADYPDLALAVARAVRRGEAAAGILVDGAGIGSSMAANKVPGVRAALCVDVAAAKNAREHNDANVLTLGARFVDAARAQEIVAAFLGSSCTEERHQRRVAKITAIEESFRR